MNKTAVIYILYSGLKYYEKPKQNEDVFYYDPRTNTLYPQSKAVNIKNYDKYLLVDSNITTGTTVFSTIRRLGIPESRVEVKGPALTEYASRIVKYIVPSVKPLYNRALIMFAGRSGTIKSFLAKGIGESHGIPVVQVGKIVRKHFDVGKYGEKLAELERDNPFIVGEILYDYVSSYSDRVVIVDGVKSIETSIFLSYTTRIPKYIYFVEVDESLRREVVALRGDEDDAYDEERNKLFDEKLRELRDQAHGIIDMNDLSTLERLCSVLEAYGYRTTRIAGYPNPFGTKLPILEMYYRNVVKLVEKGVVIQHDLEPFVFHRNYPKRLEEKLGVKLTKTQEDIINYTASAFRIVDDILDENTVRDWRPAFWVKHGFYKSMLIASLMTVKAYELSRGIGLGDKYMEMFRRIVDAVRYELKVEEGRAEFRTFTDWVKAAEREAVFREFLAYLIGMPERAREFYIWGLRAQAKDDLIGETKGGREATERRLRRPLFREEWSRELEHLSTN